MPRGSHHADASHRNAKRLLKALLDYQSKKIERVQGLQVRWKDDTSYLIVEASSTQSLIDLTSRDFHEDLLSKYQINNAIDNMRDFLGILQEDPQNPPSYKKGPKKQIYTIKLPLREKREILICFDKLWNDKRLDKNLDPINLAQTSLPSHSQPPSDSHQDSSEDTGDTDSSDATEASASHEQQSSSSSSLQNLFRNRVGESERSKIHKLNSNHLQTLKPDTPGRPMALDSPFYVTLPNEERSLEEIIEPGVLIRIRASRRMGKTSLIYRILAYAHTKGYRTVYLNLKQQTDARILTDLDQFLQWFCSFVSESLELTPQPDCWSDGGKHSCTKYLQECVLKQLNTPLVLVLDEVDCIFEYPQIFKDFSSLLRGWYEMAKNPGMEIWEQLRLVIAHSTDNYIKLDSTQSPFGNVGQPIKLPLWSRQQIQDLAQGYNLEWLASEEIDRLMAMVGGHPYLIQMALYHLWKDKEMTLEQLLNLAPTSQGIYRNHLRQLWNGVQESLLLEALKQVLKSEGNVKLDQEQGFKLEGMGLVQFQGNQVRLSCELYQHYFLEWLMAKI
ncbi:MAG: hypothetical protein F6K31_06150 [Symploca sp. SIO2G7]|nr:hypothetical protein [Symploca sp. SIO2G7]